MKELTITALGNNGEAISEYEMTRAEITAMYERHPREISLPEYTESLLESLEATPTADPDCWVITHPMAIFSWRLLKEAKSAEECVAAIAPFENFFKTIIAYEETGELPTECPACGDELRQTKDAENK